MLLNNSQVRAVHAATARLSPLLMVQGPPGTGKTQMIEALVLAVLERDRRLRVTISPSDPGSVTGRGAGRVLVCAPSNAAVDELGRRLRRAAGGSLRIVRVGAPDAISGDMVDLTLDALAELDKKDMKTIQVETAEKWCGRALAAKLMGRAERDVTEFAHEAVEHAALSGDEATLRTIRIALEEFGIET
ncbi:MAG: hypothetical protein EBZ48_11615 [Proteobacteria bacterium]|nr:hypothetical protein [Pseudomonadota bacterium]